MATKEQVEDVVQYIRGSTVVFHNAKFDIRALSTIGIDFHWDFEETLLASHCYSSADNHGLKELAIKYLDYSDADEHHLHQQVIKARNKARLLGWKLHDSTYADYWVPYQLSGDLSLENYATKDAERTMLLWQLYEPLLDELDLRQGYEREKELLKVVYKMENDGITINMDTLKNTKSFLEKEITKTKIRANHYLKKESLLVINLDSPKQLIDILHTDKGFNLPVVKTTDKGGTSTDKEVLRELFDKSEEDTTQYKFLKQLLMKRSMNSAIGYLKGYEKLCYEVKGDVTYARLYPSLNQTGTKTTRFTSSNPNGQNISKKTGVKFEEDKFSIPKLRDVFGPMPGKVWYSIDYSQLELRVFAAVSKEQSLIDALNAGYDFHGFVASQIFGKSMDEVEDSERTIAKNVNFALIFGAGPDKVNATAGIPNAYELFAGQFPNAIAYMQKVIREVKRLGHLRTVDGYRLDVSRSAPYKGVNYLVQGTAGRIVKSSMVKIGNEDWFDWKSIRLVLQIHDELIIEVDEHSPYNSPQYIHRIMSLMSEAGLDMGINTPVDADIITTDWGHGRAIKVTPTNFYLDNSINWRVYKALSNPKVAHAHR